MANSSDWLALLARDEPRSPSWLAGLGGGGDERADAAFRPGPFGRLSVANGAVPAAPQLAPDPAFAAEEAVAEAFARGLAEGRSAGQAEAEAAAGHQRALRLALRALDAAALEALAADLAETVAALCAGALAECALDPAALSERCRHAALRLGGAPESLALRLHPADLAALSAEALPGWVVHPDPRLERGALLLEGPGGAVSDGPAEWSRAIAEALAG